MLFVGLNFISFPFLVDPCTMRLFEALMVSKTTFQCVLQNQVQISKDNEYDDFYDDIGDNFGDYGDENYHTIAFLVKINPF